MTRETIPEMRARHKREVREAVEAAARARITQKHAAPFLGLTPQGLNAIIQRENIFWPVIRQGQQKRTG